MRIEKQVEGLERSIGKYDEAIKQKKSIIKIIILSIVVWATAAIVWYKQDKRFFIISLAVAVIQATKLVFWCNSLDTSSQIRHELKKIKRYKEEELEDIDYLLD